MTNKDGGPDKIHEKLVGFQLFFFDFRSKKLFCEAVITNLTFKKKGLIGAVITRVQLSPEAVVSGGSCLWGVVIRGSCPEALCRPIF